MRRRGQRAVATLWAVMRTEMRLTCRRRSFWIVQGLVLLAGVLPWLFGGRVGEVTGLQGILATINTFIVVELLFAPLIVGPAVSRDLGQEGEVLWATPLDALTHIAGVVSGLWLALLPALLTQIGTCWLLSSLLSGIRAGLFWTCGAPLLIVAMAAGMGLVALMTMLLRRTLPVLIIWGALYLLTSAGLDDSARQATSLLNITFSALELSPSLGLGLYQPLVNGLSLWFLGVGGLAASMAVGIALLVDRRRAIRHTSLFVPCVLIAGALGGSGFQIRGQLLAQQVPPASPVDIQQDAWTVHEHSLQATVDGQHGTVAGTTNLVLEPIGSLTTDQIVLRLNPGIELSEARDGSGRGLAATRAGDGVIITLSPIPAGAGPEPAEGPGPGPVEGRFSLHLAWGGEPSHPPLAEHQYPLGWGFQAVNTPQPLRALIVDGVGFLLRDGDWYPWPWTTRPHQAESNRVALQMTTGSGPASLSLPEVWEGELPPALLVMPPQGEHEVAEGTVHVGSLAGDQMIERLGLFAELIPSLSEAIGDAQPPTHIVALPYLSDFVWSGDLLLVPEGIGYISSVWIGPAYRVGVTRAIEKRAILTALARAWLSGHSPVPSRLIWAEARWRRWLGHPGRWIEPLDFGREHTYALTRVGQADAVALWISVELADPDVRQTILALLRTPTVGDHGAIRADVVAQLLPLSVGYSQEEINAIVSALHEWAEEIGRERALSLVGDVVRRRSGLYFDLERLLADLERASGASVVERWRRVLETGFRTRIDGDENRP